MGKVAKSKSPDTSHSQLVEQFLYYDHQAYERLTQADQGGPAQGRNAGSRAPVFGVAGELNPDIRVTAEAEMGLPSPPFSLCRQRRLQNSSKASL